MLGINIQVNTVKSKFIIRYLQHISIIIKYTILFIPYMI